MGYGNYSPHGGFDRHVTGLEAFDRVSGKRVKANFTTDQTIHVWAQRTQTCGQNGKRSVYFEGDKLYSYGSHFILAQFVEGKGGRPVALVNSEKSSPTTSGHQYTARRAIDDSKYLVLRVPGAQLDHVANLENFAKRIEAGRSLAKRGRSEWSRESGESEALNAAAEAYQYAQAFGLKFKLDGASPESVLAAAEAQRKKIAADVKRREAAQRKVDAEHFADWQAGARSIPPRSYYTASDGSAYVRVKGDNLETSQGAVVPLAHAVRVFRFVKRVKETGREWSAPQNTVPLRVGDFRVDWIDRDGNFKAGCHRFTWATIEAAARAVGVADLPAADYRLKVEQDAGAPS